MKNFNDVHTFQKYERSCAERNVITIFVVYILQEKVNNSKIVYTPTDIQRDFKKAHGINLTYMQAWRAMKKAIELLRDNSKDSYT